MTVCLRVRCKASEKQSGFDKQNSFWSSIIKMLSTKTQTLSSEDLERYKEKIVVVDGKDPYTFSYDAKVLPLSVDYDMVLTYLLNTLSFRTGEPVRNHKSLEACKSFERGFVKEVKGRKYKHIYAVFGKVLHSMRLSDPPAECWILIQAVKSTSKEPGEIHSAHCDCTAGAGETCSHVAAVLYALCYARETCLDKKISVTELPAYWTQPSGSAQENLYKPVEDVNFGREVQTSCELREYNLEKSNDELKALILELSRAGQDVAASKAFFKPSELNAEEDDARFYAENMLSFKKMFDADLVGRPLIEIIDHGKEIDWSFTNEDCMLVEELTRGQSSEPLWFKLRYGRVTASCFGKVVKTRIDSPSMTLINYICGESASQEFPATLYGKRNEHKAIAAAEDLFKLQKHKDFRTRKSGLIINTNYPYFAASPDCVFDCSCCGTVVIEAKCPYKFEHFQREDGIRSLITRQNPYILRDNDGNLKMNDKHEYYFQVQMQIHLSKASFALFVVWAPKFTLFIKVTKNEVFWKINSLKASKFFEQVLVPEILTNFFTIPSVANADDVNDGTDDRM